jgi:hypothetical protein
MDQFLFGVGAQKLPSCCPVVWHCPWHLKLTMVPFPSPGMGIPARACMHTAVSVGSWSFWCLLLYECGWSFWCLLLYVCFRIQLFPLFLPQDPGIPGSACTL